jgi:cellulose synthase/poly-beta-1,6-N-acetylglucosamine synthase-like glycosyltransferase
MLLDMLTLALWAMALATVALLALGRGQRRPGRMFSVLAVTFFTGAGAICGMSRGVPVAPAMVWMLVSMTLGVVLITLLPDWNAIGHATLLFTSEAGLLYLVVAGVIVLLGSTTVAALTLGLLLWGLQFLAVTLGLSFAFEMLDVVCRRRWRLPEAMPPKLRAQRWASLGPDGRPSSDKSSVAAGWLPRVLLQVPCHDEPPDVVIRTLQALARMDYPRDRYDVMVVDNNTEVRATWEPVEEVCERLGFTFLHLERWPGYKSGALNYALALTPDTVDIIGVVDADYLVRPDYLHDLVGYFYDPRVAFVQTPQDYRDYRPESTFYQRACYHAYRYFFDLSMPSRNERNAIIFGGTMGLIRTRALRAIGGWDEWCITEDAEASLRLLARGWQGRFVNQSYGKGLMPLEFDALKRQRFRWCFGGIQILRKHWHMLSPLSWRGRPLRDWDAPGLSLAQRYHYLLGGLQWYSDVLTFVFTTILLVTGWLLVAGRPVNLPGVSGLLLVLPLTFWMSSLLRTLWALRATRRCSWAEAIGAVGILWSLSWVVTLAAIQGVFRRRGVFLRTPKAGKANLLAALRSTTIETLLGLGSWSVAAVLLVRSVSHVYIAYMLATHAGQRTAVGIAWIARQVGPWWALSGSAGALAILAVMQGIVYLSAPALCLLSLRTAPSAEEARRRALDDRPGESAVERRLLVGAVAGVAVLAALLLFVSLAPGQQVSQQRQQTLTHLLGPSNPVVPPTATPTAAAGGGVGAPAASATPTIPGAANTPVATATPTIPSAAGTPTPSTPRATPSPTPRATAQPTPHATPPPHP